MVIYLNGTKEEEGQSEKSCSAHWWIDGEQQTRVTVMWRLLADMSRLSSVHGG